MSKLRCLYFSVNFSVVNAENETNREGVRGVSLYTYLRDCVYVCNSIFVSKHHKYFIEKS